MKNFKLLAIVNRAYSQTISLRDLERLTAIFKFADEMADDRYISKYDLIDILERAHDRSANRGYTSDHDFEFRVYDINDQDHRNLDLTLAVDVIVRDKEPNNQ